MFICVLTHDPMFSQTAPREFVDDVAYSVRGSIDAGLDKLLLESPMSPPVGSSLPIEVVDLVSWAGLRPTPLARRVTAHALCQEVEVRREPVLTVVEHR